MKNKRSFIKFLSFLKVINIKESLAVFVLFRLFHLLFGAQITFNLQLFGYRIFDWSHLLSSNGSYSQRAWRIKFIHIFSYMSLLVLLSIWRRTLNFTTKILTLLFGFFLFLKVLLRPHKILKVLTCIRSHHHRLFFGLNGLKTGRIEYNRILNWTWNRFNYNTLYHIRSQIQIIFFHTIYQTLMHRFILDQ